MADPFAKTPVAKELHRAIQRLIDVNDLAGVACDRFRSHMLEQKGTDPAIAVLVGHSNLREASKIIRKDNIPNAFVPDESSELSFQRVRSDLSVDGILP